VEALSEFLDERLSADVARSRDDRALLLDAVLAPGGVCPALCDALEAGGPYGAGWPAPRVAAGPVRVVKADVVGSGHLRVIVAGDDGRRIKTIAFRMAASPLGEAMLAAPPHRKLWVAGRVRKDEWSDRVAAELHLEDAAWCD
ncbi:MAG TPA: single-stranded-DNA-specific exonuclease RecJ, partial [Allosphingosinicella sp.]